mmetsp:Transcript_3238/g.9306  ORF Transcript_3238/g.9306 Transcript_3238/m.9306 type:complete len:242 (-) Transcript_3238:895-1620(-)
MFEYLSRFLVGSASGIRCNLHSLGQFKPNLCIFAESAVTIIMNGSMKQIDCGSGVADANEEPRMLQQNIGRRNVRFVGFLKQAAQKGYAPLRVRRLRFYRNGLLCKMNRCKIHSFRLDRISSFLENAVNISTNVCSVLRPLDPGIEIIGKITLNGGHNHGLDFIRLWIHAACLHKLEAELNIIGDLLYGILVNNYRNLRRRFHVVFVGGCLCQPLLVQAELENLSPTTQLLDVMELQRKVL